MKPYIALAALAALSLPAAAQQSKSDPADPAVAVPPVKYESTFTGYTPYRDQGVVPWREANDEVARAGGHAGIFRDHGKHTPAKPAAKSPVEGASAAHDAGSAPKPREKPAKDHSGHH